MLDPLPSHQTTILSFDADPLLLDKLERVSKTNLTVVEINCPDKELLSTTIKSFPGLRIGAGGITDTQQLEDCYELGVQFVTSPGFLPALCQQANVYNINYIPGIATLSEAMQAAAVGCQTVRVLPASLTLCASIAKYLPLLRLFPAEITWDQAEHFLGVPSVAAVSLLNVDLDQLSSLSTLSV